jgi:hypothetical protein
MAAAHSLRARGAAGGVLHGLLGPGGAAKKLADAARHWARGAKRTDDDAGDDDTWENELRGFGVPEPEIAHALGERAADPEERERFEIWEENGDVLELFLALSTQWRALAGAGGALMMGFDYAGVAATLWIRRVRDRARVFGDLQVMELAALKIMNRSRDD